MCNYLTGVLITLYGKKHGTYELQRTKTEVSSQHNEQIELCKKLCKNVFETISTHLIDNNLNLWGNQLFYISNL